MGDETAAAPPRIPSDLFEHYCEHPGCNLWGLLGYEPVKGQNRWWCWEHFPDEEWKAARCREKEVRD